MSDAGRVLGRIRRQAKQARKLRASLPWDRTLQVLFDWGMSSQAIEANDRTCFCALADRLDELGQTDQASELRHSLEALDEPPSVLASLRGDLLRLFEQCSDRGLVRDDMEYIWP
jgi:hypothetical protein